MARATKGSLQTRILVVWTRSLLVEAMHIQFELYPSGLLQFQQVNFGWAISKCDVLLSFRSTSTNITGTRWVRGGTY
jgi:hypothetical protein